ncbi:zinc finger MYND domain-containing protein 12 isoform X2 [Rhinatrema bivittatum]|uniref:zinc finger MYND domain-containing protein 12 isoform X2 n=1 Tax=Rhinatrema bivittatum TaxID=194408 RepID=UPI001127D7F0|nr:zinc finger MYND domain-containing protein 12 isoform X2 [Rhinatrema bivittatum]
MEVYPLAQPKWVKLRCELCGNTAYLQCPKCKVTYYCDMEHMQADFFSIHEKICPLLIALRTRFPFFITDTERQSYAEQMIQRKKHVIYIAHQEAQKFVSQGKHRNALPAALHSLRFSIDVYGLKSIELVPAYLVLAEANIGLGDLMQAQEYLAQAQWTVLKSPDCGSSIQHKLHRNLGRLYAAEGNFQESLYHLANDIYHSSEAFGTDDLRTTGGYFQMANVFFRLNKRDIADSLYTEVIDIWYNHLSGLAHLQLQALKESSQILISSEIKVEGMIDDAQKIEGIQILQAILDIREQASAPAPAKAQQFANKVLVIHEQFPKLVVPEILPRILEWIKPKLLSST